MSQNDDALGRAAEESGVAHVKRLVDLWKAADMTCLSSAATNDDVYTEALERRNAAERALADVIASEPMMITFLMMNLAHPL